MSDESDRPQIKVTDKRHFDRTGEKRPEGEAATESGSEGSGGETPRRPGGPQTVARSQGSGPISGASTGRSEGHAEKGREGASPGDLSSMAQGISSSFNLLVARLAQETEIYLGLVPYPGKETAEPDLEAARAMIDLLSMLQEKTRGNLDAEESRLLENLLYTYRLEFVRLRSGGGVR